MLIFFISFFPTLFFSSQPIAPHIVRSVNDDKHNSSANLNFYDLLAWFHAKHHLVAYMIAYTQLMQSRQRSNDILTPTHAWTMIETSHCTRFLLEIKQCRGWLNAHCILDKKVHKQETI